MEKYKKKRRKKKFFFLAAKIAHRKFASPTRPERKKIFLKFESDPQIFCPYF